MNPRLAKLWTVRDLSAYLDIPVSTIYQWRCDGYGPRGRKVGRWVRYDPEDVRAWLDSLPDQVA